MTWLRKLLEKWLGKFHEGPEPPIRLAEEVRLFQLAYPMATPDEWRAFAIRMADKAYRQGYLRGLEWAERAPDDLRHPELPAALEDARKHDWSPSEHPLVREILASGDPSDPMAGVPAEARAEFYGRLGEALGTHAVVIVDPNQPPSPDPASPYGEPSGRF